MAVTDADTVSQSLTWFESPLVGVAVAHPPEDAFGQQVSQDAVDGGVRLAENERQLRRIDGQRPAEDVEQLSV